MSRRTKEARRAQRDRLGERDATDAEIADAISRATVCGNAPTYVIIAMGREVQRWRRQAAEAAADARALSEPPAFVGTVDEFVGHLGDEP